MSKLTIKEWLLVIGGFVLVLGVRLLPALLTSAEDEAGRLGERWSEAGLSPTWESERCDLSGKLILEGFSGAGFSAERLIHASESLFLHGVSAEADSLLRLLPLAESIAVRGVSLDGAIALSYGLELAVELAGELTPAGLTLGGEGFLRRGGAELPVQTALVISPERVLINLTSTESRLLAELHPRLAVIDSTIQTEELAQLYPELPFRATGSVHLRGLPDDSSLTIETAELELRRRNAPLGWLFRHLHFALNGEDWRLRTDTVLAAGNGEKVNSLSLDKTLDLGQLAGSLLPLGYQGSGELTVQLSLSEGKVEEFRFSGDSLSLSSEDFSLGFSGWLSYRSGSFDGAFEFDPGCGALQFTFTDGVAEVSGDGLELNALHRSFEALLSQASGYLQSLLENQSATIVLTNCRLGDYDLGELTGRLRYANGVLDAELKLSVEDGGATADWSLTAGRLRFNARWHRLPLVLLNALGLPDSVISPTAGRCDGSLRLTQNDGEPTAINLSLTAEELSTPLPPQVIALWNWADLSAEPPRLDDGELDFTWRWGGGYSGEVVLRLTSPSLRVTLNRSSWVDWSGEIDLSGVLEVPPKIARRAAERGVLIFRRADGWGAIPFALGGSISDPQPRLDTEQARQLAATEPPPD